MSGYALSPATPPAQHAAWPWCAWRAPPQRRRAASLMAGSGKETGSGLAVRGVAVISAQIFETCGAGTASPLQPSDRFIAQHAEQPRRSG
jgi:hypothetical protein